MSSAYGQCTCCGTIGYLDAHHKWPQTKWAKKLYKELIHAPINIQLACNGCHAGHSSPKLIHWTEKQFCEALGIQPRSKTERGKE
jgi:predicted CXXCH cytochrome family protein